MATDQALKHFAEHRAGYLEDLKKLVRIPSVSFPGFDPAKVRASAEATASLLRERGFSKVQLLEVEGAHPYVYGEILEAPGSRRCCSTRTMTCKPAGAEEAWASPPFEPTERKGGPDGSPRPLWARCGGR
jgi:acetylornithine deacetylase/succinyl-diaminopimelate desuccinylase-like protein